MKNLILGGVLGFCLAIACVVVLGSAPSTSRPRALTDYSRLLAAIDEGNVEEVTIGGAHVLAKMRDGTFAESILPSEQLVPAFIDRLLAKGVRVAGRPLPQDEPSLVAALINWAPFLVFVAGLLLVQ
jgi:cell division protease FtsH